MDPIRSRTPTLEDQTNINIAPNNSAQETPVEIARIPREETSPEQRSAQFEMFAQGANNGGVVQNRVIEEPREVKQAEEVKAPAIEVSQEDIERFNALQSTLVNGIFSSQANVMKFFQLKVGQVNPDDFIELANSRLQEANLSADCKLLFNYLKSSFTLAVAVSWSKVLPPQLFIDAEGNKKIIGAIVTNEIIDQMESILDNHNMINPHYLEMVKQTEGKREIQEKIAIINELLKTMPFTDAVAIKDLLNLDGQEVNENQSNAALSEKGEPVFDQIILFFSTLNETELKSARECLLKDIIARVEKGD